MNKSVIDGVTYRRESADDFSRIEELFWGNYLILKPPALDGLQREYEVLGEDPGQLYRIDFALPRKKIGIELDGYEFHSDKDTFTRDRQRGRELQRLGWTVIHFSGREVFKDATKCVLEASAQIALTEAVGDSPTNLDPDKALLLEDIKNAELIGVDLSGVDLSGVDLEGRVLRVSDLSNTKLVGACLESADLTGANLTGSDLRGANLINADLTKADLTGANLTNAHVDLMDALRDGATLTDANLGELDTLQDLHRQLEAELEEQAEYEREVDVEYYLEGMTSDQRARWYDLDGEVTIEDFASSLISEEW